MYQESREFTLAEYGMAEIVETDDETGPAEGDFRSYYSSDSKQVREHAEGYVKFMYLADSLKALEHGDLADLDKPGSVRFVSQGEARGYRSDPRPHRHPRGESF